MIARIRTPLVQLQIVLIAALLLGGGGVAYGLDNLIVQLMALAVLAAQPALVARFAREAPAGLRLLVLVSLAFPLVQLVPLPPGIWMALPGRSAAAESFVLVGVSAQWFPLSLDPARTLVAFCGTLAPAAILVIGSGLRREERVVLVHTVLVACLCAFMLGAMQLLSGNTSGLLYDERPRGDVLYATFANRNSTALLFVLALALLAAMPWPRRSAWRWAWGAAVVAFAVGTLLTQSRSGIALLTIPVVIAGARAILRSRRVGRGAVAACFLAVALFGAGAFALANTDSRMAASLDRFATGAADRPEMWEDSLYAARVYGPVGSGMGTFDEVFQLHESLEHVSPRKAGRAHSDWLEIAIEGGFLAVLIAAGWVIWIALAALPRGSPEGIWLRLGAGGGLAAIALQSLLDYPLRNQSLLCVAALLVVLMIRERERQQ